MDQVTPGASMLAHGNIVAAFQTVAANSDDLIPNSMPKFQILQGELHQATASTSQTQEPDTQVEAQPQPHVSNQINQNKLPRAKGGTPITQMMSISEAVKILLTQDPNTVLSKVPPGDKTNVYFVVDNTRNIERLKLRQRSFFNDDYGVWDSKKAKSERIFLYFGQGDQILLLTLKGGVYTKQTKHMGKRVFVPLDPQPDESELTLMMRYTIRLKSNHQIKRRVTWLQSDLHEKYALWEYLASDDVESQDDAVASTQSLMIDHGYGTLDEESTYTILTNQTFTDANTGQTYVAVQINPTLPECKEEKVPRAKGGSPIETFMSTSELVKIFLTYQAQNVLSEIPEGNKANMYFIVDNSENTERRKSNQNSMFIDDCGKWDAGGAKTEKVFLQFGENNQIITLAKKGGIYVKLEPDGKGGNKFTLLKPQPNESEIIVLMMNSSHLKDKPSLRKRVTWMEFGVHANIAVWEYIDETVENLPPTPCEDVSSAFPAQQEEKEAVEDVLSLHETLKKGIAIKQFLGINELAKILITSEVTSCLDSIPLGDKTNRYFLVDNLLNVERRRNGQNSIFHDDCGIWESTKCRTERAYLYFGPNLELLTLQIRDGLYCKVMKNGYKGKRTFTPLDPQPNQEDIFIMVRYRTALKRDHTYRKRVTYMETGLNTSVALWEYMIVPDGSQRQVFVEDSDDDTTDSLQTEKAIGGTLISEFLSIAEMIKLLKNVEPHEVLSGVPPGNKSNMRFIIDNKVNVSRRKSRQGSVFKDDCGKWDPTKGKTEKILLVQGEMEMQSVIYREGLYCTLWRNNNERKYIPLPVQPNDADITTLCRFRSTLKKHPSFKKRVSWIESNDYPCVAVWEYIDEITCSSVAQSLNGTRVKRRNFKKMMHGISISRYLSLASLLRILLASNPAKITDQVPAGDKTNKYFIVNNRYQLDNRFEDDLSWDSERSETEKVLLQIHDDFYQVVYEREGLYCSALQLQGEKQFVPINPQPDSSDITVLVKLKMAMKDKPEFSKRVTWVESSPISFLNVSVWEYLSVPNSRQTLEDDFEIESEEDVGKIDFDVELETPFMDGQEGHPISQHLTLHDLVKILLVDDASHALPAIPPGDKKNKYYIVDDTTNIERRKNKQNSVFSDDYSCWDSSKGTTKTSLLYFIDDNSIKNLTFKDGQYCIIAKIRGVKTWVPLEPQPDKSEVTIMKKYCTALKQNPNFKKRVTWIEYSPMPFATFAVWEYFCADSIVSHNDASIGSSITPGGSPISELLSVKELLEIFKRVDNSSSVLPSIPKGNKWNMSFIVDNSLNIERRKSKMHSLFSDDCGVWDSSRGSTHKTYLKIGSNSKVTTLEKKDGVYCRVSKSSTGSRTYQAVNPQPDESEIAVMVKYRTVLKDNPNLIKRVTWMESGIDSKVAVWEYLDSAGQSYDHYQQDVPEGGEGSLSKSLMNRSPKTVKSRLYPELQHKTADDTDLDMVADEGISITQFLSTSELIQALTSENTENVLDKIPDGIKINKYFIVDNSTNVERKKAGRRSVFTDDYGPWDSIFAKSERITLYVTEGQPPTNIAFKNGMYYVLKRINNQRVYYPMEPQPEEHELTVLMKYSTRLKDNPSFRKRVTWLMNEEQSRLAVWEYVIMDDKSQESLLNEDLIDRKKSCNSPRGKTLTTSPKKTTNLSPANNVIKTELAEGGMVSIQFLEPQQLFQVLTSVYPDSIHENIPEGDKRNMYFFVDNSLNVEKQEAEEECEFEDDYGSWSEEECKIEKAIHVVGMGDDDFFCSVVGDGEDEEPEDINLMTVLQYTFTLKSDPKLKKRVSWIKSGHESVEMKVALWEYIMEEEEIEKTPPDSCRRSMRKRVRKTFFDELSPPTKKQRELQSPTKLKTEDLAISQRSKQSLATPRRGRKAIKSDVSQHDKVCYAQGGTHLSKFLNPVELAEQLMDPEAASVLKTLPEGKKENMYFIVENIRRGKMRPSAVVTDDCGTWLLEGTKPEKILIYNEDNEMTVVRKMDDVFMKEENLMGKKAFVPFDPQPDESDITVLLRYNCYLKGDPDYKKRVTWVDSKSHSKVAVWEYVKNPVSEGKTTSTPASQGRVKREWSSPQQLSSSKVKVRMTHEDSMQVLPSPNVSGYKPKAGGGFPIVEFLSLPELVRALVTDDSAPVLKKIPKGNKSNMYFIVDNSENIHRHQMKQEPIFNDDCGLWDPSKTTTEKVYLLFGDTGQIKILTLKDGVYSIRKVIRGKLTYLPLEPQPDMSEITVLVMHQTCLKEDASFQKRVSWVEWGLHLNVAVWEYIGSYPQEEHGQNN